MSNKNSFEHYGLLKQINNENFYSVKFHIIKINNGIKKLELFQKKINKNLIDIKNIRG